MDARWIRLDGVTPPELYACCQALGDQSPTHVRPVVLWARCDRAHVSLGASQDPALELDLAACRAREVAVERRPLGGGAVLVDPDQWCFVFVVPRLRGAGQRGRFFDQCLAPATATLRSFGIPAERAGVGDVWVAGRKILGSGAATLQGAEVFGASFLLRFPRAAFAALIRVPNDGFRGWLRDELDAGMTDWATHAPLPDAGELEARFRGHVTKHLGWRLTPGALTAVERAALPEARMELAEPHGAGGRRRVVDGIKIRHGVYLLERDFGTLGRVRLVLRDGLIVRLRVWSEGVAEEASGQELRGAWAPGRGAVAWGSLRGVGAVEPLAERIEEMAVRTLDQEHG
ncbi:MAG: hypothetical protein B7Z66_01035 [Chromatiales bacterium 21-64-14]|nr:MAG: hypothetical protein B7Z66_01035 [Chromatiales bacterium 21-64-14]HQU16044.1 biotin--protein ligase [Gammaproteobacteria bacterium]